MRVLCLGDSLGLPRPHRINNYQPSETDLAVRYDQTYSSIIQKELLNLYYPEKYFEVINRSERFTTIKDIYEEFTDYLFFYEPNIITVQVGVVDCWYREHLNGKQMVNIKEFESYLQKILELLKFRSQVKVVLIGICLTNSKMNKRYSYINQEIKKYNSILKQYADSKQIFYLDTKVLSGNALLPDGVHLSPTGNKILAQELLRFIQNIYLNEQGVKSFENDIQEAVTFFEEAHERYRYNNDTIYNLLSITHMLGERDKLKLLLKEVKGYQQLDSEVLKLIDQLELLSAN